MLGPRARISPSAARDAPEEAPAEPRVELREDELVGDLPPELEPEGHGLAALLVAAHLASHRERPLEDLPLRRRARLRRGEDARVDLLEDARHAADEVRAHLGEVVAQLVEVLGERGREAVGHAQERLEPRERMGERKEEEVDVALFHRRRLHRRVDGGDVVAVGLHDALRRPRRARRVDDRRELLGPGPPHALGERGLVRGFTLAAEPAQRLPRQHHLRRLRRVVARDDDDLLEPRHLLPHLQGLGELGRVLDDQGLRLRVVDHVGDEVRRVGRIDRHRDAASAEDREVGLDPLGAARRQERDALALLAADRDEPEGDLPHDPANFAPGERLPPGSLLERLRGPARASLHPVPEQARECIGSHDCSP